MKASFKEGMKSLRQVPSPAPLPIPSAPGKQASRDGKVAIAAYFELPVRQQLAILAARQNTTQVALLAEALNLLFEKYGDSPIAKA